MFIWKLAGARPLCNRGFDISVIKVAVGIGAIVGWHIPEIIVQLPPLFT